MAKVHLKTSEIVFSAYSRSKEAVYFLYLVLQVQKTHCAAKATKESSILRQHRQVWSKECPRLQKAE